MRRLTLLTGFIFLTYSIFGQANTGFQGKRFILKTDLMAPLVDKGVDISTEYVIFRTVVVGAGFNFTGRDYKQKLESYKFRYGSYPEEKATLKDFQVYAVAKLFLNNAIPAPQGSYAFAQIHLGRADIKGNYYQVDNVNPENESLLSYSSENIRSRKFTAGFGYQEVLLNFITLDFDFGLTLGALNASEKFTINRQDFNFVHGGFGDRYGPNVYSFGEWGLNQGGIGLTVNLRVGILLF